VLGHPEYYSKLGFRQVNALRITGPFGALR